MQGFPGTTEPWMRHPVQQASCEMARQQDLKRWHALKPNVQVESNFKIAELSKLSRDKRRV